MLAFLVDNRPIVSDRSSIPMKDGFIIMLTWWTSAMNKSLSDLKSANSEETSAADPGNRTLLLPLAFTLGLAGLTLLAPIRQNPKVVSTFLGAAAALCVWNA